MYPLPDPPDETQHTARESTDNTWQVASEAVVGLIALAGSMFIVHRLLSANEGDFQLQILYGTIKLLHSVARFVGTCALNAENAYNEHVYTLH